MKLEEIMFTIYVYVLDTLADWELGHVISELNSGRFFKKGAQRVSLKTVSYSKDPIHTMGGMTIVPDCFIDDIVVSKTSMLLCRDQIHGTTQSMPLSSRKQVNFSP